MLKVVENLKKVRDMYTEETPALTSELFAMREMGIPLEGGIRVQQGYLFRADHFNRMDKLSPEEFQGYVDKFPEFQEKMANLVKKYNYYYPEQPGTIPKFVDTEDGRYTLIEKTGGQMCDGWWLECVGKPLDGNVCVAGGVVVEGKSGWGRGHSLLVPPSFLGTNLSLIHI